MKQYQIILQKDYDKNIKINKQSYQCYSKKQLEKLYAKKDYQIIGEASYKNKKTLIAKLEHGDSYLDVCEYGKHNSFLYKKAGFVCVGEDEYIALLKSRIPFLILFTGILLGLIISLYLILSLWFGLNIPDHPLPPVDASAELIPDDHTEKQVSENGGGSVSMIYTTDVSMNLSTGKADIHFKNPNASNHDVVLELFVTSEGEEVLIAESGLLKAGYGLYELALAENSTRLREGVYNGLYRVSYYNPETGERSIVQSDIENIKISVME